MTNIKRTQSGQPLYVYSSKGSALVNFSSDKQNKKIKHESAKPSDKEEEGKKSWIPWGANDKFPDEIIELIRKSTVGRSALHLLTKAIYGQRLFTYIEAIDEKGKAFVKRVEVPEWEEIKARSNFNVIRAALIQDYAFFGWNNPEIRFNANKTKVYGIDYHKVHHSRLAPVKDGRIPFVYIHGNISEAKESDCQKLPVIDFIRYPDQIEEIKKNTGYFKYAFPQFFPDTVNDYYPLVYWDSARSSGQLDIATSIPLYKKYLFKNQMSLKYDIQIPMSYLTDLYTDWEKMSIDDQDIAIEELYDEILECLTGAENAQKALLSFYKVGQDGKPSGQWIVKTIDDKMKNDAYLPDAAAANSEILFAMLVNPATTGQGNTGGSYNGGSNNGGSNIRESLEVMRSMLKMDRDIIYSFFEFVKMYNGLDSKLKLGIEDTALATLDTGTSIFTENS